MKTTILGLLAETFIHPGAESTSGGAIDKPVNREASTQYPYVPGSGVKGALREKARTTWGVADDDPKVTVCFGEPDKAGLILPFDAKLLLLPVRSLNSQYRWLTCPLLLERYLRDLKFCGQTAPFELPTVGKHSVLSFGEGSLFLEEQMFSLVGSAPADVCRALRQLIPHGTTEQRLDTQLCILHNEDFQWFASYGLPVTARNCLDNDTKQSKNLWYEESLPPDSLFYCLIAEREEVEKTGLETLFTEHPYLRLGGNETVGQGWFAVAMRQPEELCGRPGGNRDE
ncbi:type III-B CRISPR module RAMP protein Cmr4 [Pseudodesulfovibrio sp.]|uniref:type III-B CRISPR module RAMP protein Cmr4 n=1 Tax=unclassified Pseudodesulfovibrio TaxID=2661612 RepID=UPI003B005FEE